MSCLEEAISTILMGSDLSSVSVKAVRRSLAENTDAGVQAELGQLDKEATKALILAVYDRIVPQPSSESQEEEEVVDEGTAVIKTEEEPQPQTKTQTQTQTQEQEQLDAALARQLQSAEAVGRARRSSAPLQKPKPKPKPKAKGSSSTGTTPKKRAGGGFSKLQVLSEPLQTLMRATSIVHASNPDLVIESDSASDPADPAANADLPITDLDPNSPVMLSRPEVVKRLWIYIKAHNLQDPSDKRTILCDPLMEAVFKTKKLGMFKMNKFLGDHIKNATDVVGDLVPSSGSKQKSFRGASSSSGGRKSKDYVVESDDEGNADSNADSDDEINDEDDDDDENNDDIDSMEDVDTESTAKHTTKPAAKKRKIKHDSDEEDFNSAKKKRSNGVFSKPYNLSPELQVVVGSAEPIARHEAVKKIWEYIKLHDLQDPNDRRFIMCDTNLQAVLGQPRMNKVLGDHLYKIE
ncbi:UNVERIFIED_CONTAM: hypothetical protein HDU68_008637 [Siphonaria sp. JEL0065]|nr:hypothetical protein HDU68_008637 [Siphonaria sp. JEL0065]